MAIRPSEDHLQEDLKTGVRAVAAREEARKAREDRVKRLRIRLTPGVRGAKKFYKTIDDAKIRYEYANERNMDNLCFLLGRSKTALYCKARKMGLAKKEPRWLPEETALVMTLLETTEQALVSVYRCNFPTSPRSDRAITVKAKNLRRVNGLDSPHSWSPTEMFIIYSTPGLTPSTVLDMLRAKGSIKSLKAVYGMRYRVKLERAASIV